MSRPVPPSPGSFVIDERLPWARDIIRQAVADHGAPLPTYGSDEWAAAPAAQRWAAAVVAAECWRIEGLPEVIAERFRAELEVEWRAAKADEDAAYVAGIAEHRDRWSHLGRIRSDLHASRVARLRARQAALDADPGAVA